MVEICSVNLIILSRMLRLYLKALTELVEKPQ